MRVIVEKVRDSEGSSFQCRSISEVGFYSPHHLHPEIEILQINQGAGHLVVGDHIGRFAGGDLMIFGSDLPHMLYSDTSLEGERLATHLRYAQLRPDILGPEFFNLNEAKTIGRLITLSRRGLRYGPATSEAASGFFDRMLLSRGFERLLSLLELMHLLANATDGKEMTRYGYAPVSTHRSSERLERTIRFINQHLTDDISVGDIASVAGLSVQAFSRFFRDIMGVSCIEYIIALRIGLACRYLLETDESITSIAFRVGFCNISNFNRHFKKAKNTTPQNFRKLAIYSQNSS